MSLPGRPKGEYRSAKHGGCLMSPPGRPKGEYRRAKSEGTLMSRRAHRDTRAQARPSPYDRSHPSMPRTTPRDEHPSCTG